MKSLAFSRFFAPLMIAEANPTLVVPSSQNTMWADVSPPSMIFTTCGSYERPTAYSPENVDFAGMEEELTTTSPFCISLAM